MTFRIYRDQSDEWRWKLVARNGRIVGDSGEGYKRKFSAEKSISRFSEEVRLARITVEE